MSEFSNGNKAVCSKEKLRFDIIETFPRTIRYTMENYQQALYSKSKENVNALIGYEIYYREITEEQFLAKNISRFEGLDACSSNIWNINDFRPSDLSPSSCTDGSADCGLSAGANNEFPVNVYKDEDGLLPMSLRPFTPYALYATTLMVPYLADKATGAQTDMIYFRTRTEPPDQVRNLETRTPLQNSIKVSWAPPRNPHGIIDHYDIVLNYIPQADFARNRKFCGNKGAVDVNEKIPRVEEPSKGKANVTDMCPTCTCLPGDGQKNKIEDRGDEHIEEQEFYNELINKLFNFHTSSFSVSDRRKRSVRDNQKGNALTLLSKPPAEFVTIRRKMGVLFSFEKLVNETAFINGSDAYSTVFLRVPGNQTKVLIESLKHYALYEVKVMACQEAYKKDEDCKTNCRMQKDCSAWTVKEAKTQAKPHADDIILENGELTVFNANETTGDTYIQWKPPADPNELITHYILRSDERLGDQPKENYAELCISLSKLGELEDGWVEYRLERAGEYWISLQAVSLAGPGQATPWQYVKAGLTNILIFIFNFNQR